MFLFGGAVIENFCKQKFFRKYASFRRKTALFSGYAPSGARFWFHRGHVATGRDMVATLGAPLGPLGGPKPVPWDFVQKILGKSRNFWGIFPEFFCIFFPCRFPVIISEKFFANVSKGATTSRPWRAKARLGAQRRA